MNELKGPRRTAPATPGLLIIAGTGGRGPPRPADIPLRDTNECTHMDIADNRLNWTSLVKM